jgi:hypothetical protein
MVWQKSRSQSYRHNLYDAVRGFGQHLQPSFPDAENTVGTAVGTSFFLGATSTGFTVGVPTSGTYSGNLGTNENGTTYVGWAWNAGGSTVTNTAGSISAQVRANPTAGFSVVTYTGNATAGATIGHGLGVAPRMVIVKERGNSNIWAVGHSGLTSWAYHVRLNAVNAQSNADNAWNSTAPSSSVFTVGDITGVNRSGGTYVAYCFAEIAGFSAFGRYTGNGSSNGAFVHTGFRPKFIMIKSRSVESWELFDTSRSSFNQAVALLEADSSVAENTSSTSAIDILSNGFKQRNTRAATNSTGGDYIYMAFAEMPFKYTRAR